MQRRMSMREQLKQIRDLLNEIETGPVSRETENHNERDVFGLELPLIIQEIVDDLQPLLEPYEAAFYWYAFRHSVAENGKPHVRLSVRALQDGVLKSLRSNGISNKVSQDKMRKVLRGLETIGAIRKEGEPTREGTLYRVLLPSEIEVCRKYRKERTATESKQAISETDIDYYNVRENRIKIHERDGYRCHYCDKQLTRFTATLDHVVPVSERGTNGPENLVTACLSCNSRKHKRPVGDFLVEG